MLFKTVGAHKIDPKRLITHRFKLEQILDAYETFGNAAKTKVLKVIIAAWVRLRRERRKETASAWGYKLRPSNSSDARGGRVPQCINKLPGMAMGRTRRKSGRQLH